MNDSILIENDFEEDITKIEFYSTEEKKTLQQIVESLESFTQIYESDYVNKLNDLTDDLHNNFQTIAKNREESSQALKNVLIKYRDTAQQVTEFMEKEYE